MKIKVGTRKSRLALAQVAEVLQEIRSFDPLIDFAIISMDTIGDRDQTVSLRSLEKTDFFTREIDHLLLNYGCRIAIHSAKDLPEPLPEGLFLAAMTKGVDSKDALVLPEGISFEKLPKGSLIATSSKRREEMVASLRSDLRFTDIRGNIEERLQKMKTGDVAGVVVAEAALIRLGLDLNRMHLSGETAPYQGRLAILCREEDHEMHSLFSVLHFDQ